MKLSDFAYDLPESQIAVHPAEKRDQSRLMVVTSGKWAHQHFHDLPMFVRSGDVIVLNQTKVFPARLRGQKTTGGKIEVLLTRPLQDGAWEALVRGSTKPADLRFPEGVTARMQERTEKGEWLVQFSLKDLRPYLEQHGEMPLPPYIKRDRKETADHDRYQTVFAAHEGAVAAPTAGFHFTPELISQLRGKGVRIEFLTLHVGWGTFRPVRTEQIEDHHMLAERYLVSSETAAALNAIDRSHHRIIAVGTTVTRTLESIWNASAGYQAGSGETGLFITPGYRFRAIDALITNFHLPDSTPLLLACAFYQQKAGSSEPFSLRSAYQEAIQSGYRFYSYGDAMLID